MAVSDEISIGGRGVGYEVHIHSNIISSTPFYFLLECACFITYHPMLITSPAAILNLPINLLRMGGSIYLDLELLEC